MVLPPPPPARKLKMPLHKESDLSTTASPLPVNLGMSIASMVMPTSGDLRATLIKGKSGHARTKPDIRKKSQPKLPHERDESINTTGTVASEPMEQAFRDIAHGMQDTDRAAEMGRAYKKLKQKK